jgi:hypothetical protein
MALDIIESIKSALRAAADVGDKFDNFNTRSVARGANEQSFLFPCIMDNSVPVDFATTLDRNLDRLYASWTQIYLSSIGFIDLNYIKNPRQFIAKYQPKFRLESADDRETNIEEGYLESYDESLRSIYGEDEMLFSEAVGEDSRLYALFTPSDKNPARIMRVQKTGMTPYMEGVNTAGINNSTPVMEASIDDITDAVLANSVRNEQDRRANDFLRSAKDARAPRMSEMDAKKINDMQPYMIELKLLASKGDSSFSQWINYTIGVKTLLHLGSSDVLTKNIVQVLQDKNPIFNFVRWTTGEISLMKDIILHLDDINFDIANKRDRTGKLISSLKRLKKKYVKVGTFGINRMAPFATIAISSSTYRHIRDDYGFDLKNLTFAHKVMDELFLMCFVIIDDVTHTVDMLVDGQSAFQTYSLEMLEREVTMNSNKLGKELTRMLGS